ncbi:MAG: phosphodiester glycosidase family protein [Leptolyngbyaceae cyanobacterium SL_7_1]|nr:phosphodiester glycosidase family protein [Leptolyngbyaceae cyanobacterium SL_7_1]
MNSGYVTAGLSLYTPEWGSTYLPLTDQETLIIIQDNQVVGQQVSDVAGQAPIPIPVNGALLVARANAAAAAALPLGTRLEWTTTATPMNFNTYPHVVGGGPLLIKNRQIVLNATAEGFSSAFATQAAPRSVIATTAEGTLIVATIQNRVGGAGATLQETAQLMQQWGAIDALNLDGGSSTSLYLGGGLLNRPPQTAARVHNAIGVFLKPGF